MMKERIRDIIYIYHDIVQKCSSVGSVSVVFRVTVCDDVYARSGLT